MEPTSGINWSLLWQALMALALVAIAVVVVLQYTGN